ncbi:MAG TPA: hypothetical protein VFV03_06845 [Solirubrobacteraceae bacterium]|nr:hypothetical protein [Solirubrobacteraceae bacterium]
MSPLTDTELTLAPRSIAGLWLVAFGCGVLILALCTSSASAGTYPMYQCAPGVPAISPGWSVYGNTTNASTVLSNTCSAGGSIGDYVFTNGQAGAVTENGSNGSQVGVQIDVPNSAAGVTIHSIKAQVIASAVTGDDAFLGFSAGGQSLPGGAELSYGGASDYTASESWTLPQGARDFEAYVNCSTDRSSTTCDFADSTAVPALTDITLNLEDNTPPTVGGVSGPLATAAATGASVTGSQPISFTSADVGSGIHTASLTLSPLSGGTSYVHTFAYSGECAYDAWNACPLMETVSGFTVNTDTLANGAYAANLAVTDAAGNVTNDALGSVTVSNPTLTVSSLGALPGPGATSSHSSTGAGSPNGADASEGAHLQLGTRASVARAYAKRAVRITGRLLNAQGLPIAGASLDVLQQVAGSTLELVSHARTGTDGTFAASVAGGPSRTVEVAYRAFSSDASYSATARFVEAVRAGVQLSVTPHRTGSEGTITLTGRVLGPVPPRGVVVELLVHYRGHWEPFRDPRTNSRGRFRVVYQFQGGIGRFPFRAVVFGSQGDFPFSLGKSSVVDVNTH